MKTADEILSEFKGFRFWSTKRRPIIIYFTLYYSLYFLIIYAFEEINQGFLFFIFWIGLLVFSVITNYGAGMSCYIYHHNQELHRFIFKNIPYDGEKKLLIGSSAHYRFLFRTRNFKLDNIVKNLKINVLLFDTCTFIVFVIGFYFVINMKS